MMRPLMLLLFILLSAPCNAYEAKEPRYLDPDMLSPQLLPAPALENSPAWKKEVAEVAKEQRYLSHADKAEMEFEAKASVQMVSIALRERFGDGFDAEHYPKTFALLSQVFNDTAVVTENAKVFWETRRPYVAAPAQVRLLLEPVRNNAYPSGHTSIAYTLAEVLGILYPAERDVLRKKADNIAHHRIEAGVHYPQDIRGGKTLGAIVLGAMLSNDNFQDDLSAAKDEIEHHGN